MDLKKFLPGLEEKNKIEHFWALVIEPGWVQAGIWRIQNQKAQVIYTSPESSWNLESDLVQACDTALSAAIQNYPDEYEEPTKTVFGVSYQWVNGGEISPEHLEKIKKICKDLSLKPVGFVVLPEAISHLVKGEEGTPLNAVILGVYKESIEVSLFELGKLVGTTEVARSVSLVEDTVEGLSRLKSEGTLPSRFLVYDGKDGELEEARQMILSSNWDDLGSIKFLHTPKVELIDSKKKIYAVSLAGASELGNVTGFEDVSAKDEIPPAEEVEGEEELREYGEEDEVSPEEMGFALEKDIREEETLASDFNDDDEPQDSPSAMDMNTETESNIRPVSEDIFEKPKKRELPKIHIPVNFKGLNFNFRKFTPRFGRIHFGRSPIVMGTVIFVIFLIGFFAFWWFYPKATVTVYVSPKKLEETIEVKVETERDSSDYANRVLAGDTIKTSVSGDRTVDTTGKKTIGDKASGEVTIYRVGTEISLPGGTQITSSEKLKFVTDSAIKIASGSASTPGITKVKVSAETIGAQYNLSAGSTFSVGNYSASDMEAKNETAFAGGSSTEVSSVSKSDQEKLLSELTNELKEKALTELNDNMESDSFMIKESEEVKAAKTDFNHKVGDEAKTLKLSLNIDVSVVTIKKSELENLAKEVMKSKVPGDFVLRGEQINYEFEKTDSKSPTEFKIKAVANLLPVIDNEDIAKKIVGRYPLHARQYMQKETPGFVRAEIKINPSFPGRLKTLPHVVKNIDVQLEADR